MIKRLVIAVILLTLIAGGLVGFNIMRAKGIAGYFASRPMPTMTVSTLEVKPINWTPVIRAIGTTNAAKGVDLTVETAGVVKQIFFAPNAQVSAGQVLVQLDDAVQRADLEAARTNLALDRQALARAKALQGRGVTTNVSLDTAEAAAAAAQAQVTKLAAVVDQRVVSAPFAGVIGLPRIEVGQYVAPGSIVATLQDISAMRVDFSVPEQSLPLLTMDQALDVRIDGLDQVFAANITGIDPRVDPASRLVAVRGLIAAPDGKLTPGQFVRIDVRLPQETGVIALPQTAVVSSLYGDFAYVVRPKADAEGKLEARQVFVTTGRRSGGDVEVTAGIAPGDQVVTAGQNRLFNGVPVTVDNSVTPVPAKGLAARAGQ